MVCYVRFDVAKLDELLVKPPTAWRAEKNSENKRNELKIYVQLNDVSSCENNGKNEEKFSSDYFKVWRNSIRKWNYSFSVFRVSEFVFVEHTHTHMRRHRSGRGMQQSWNILRMQMTSTSCFDRISGASRIKTIAEKTTRGPRVDFVRCF